MLTALAAWFAIVTPINWWVPDIAGTAHLGGMWSMVAAVFVTSTHRDGAAGRLRQRLLATVVGCALCACALAIVPISVWSIAAVLGAGVLVLSMFHLDQEIALTSITSVVVMVAAESLLPPQHWTEAVVRLGATAVGGTVGWFTTLLGTLRPQLRSGDYPKGE